ncbi:hypothetical protein Dimus_032245 [Dionaea muscipula]
MMHSIHSACSQLSMESLTLFHSTSLPLKPHKPQQHRNPPSPFSSFNNSLQSHFLQFKFPFSSSHKYSLTLEVPMKPHLCLPILLGSLSSYPLNSFASDIPLSIEPPVSDKISLEAVLVSIDDFFTRNPFFVYGVAFIWLIAIPLVQAEFKKCKFVSAVDAFVKLRDDPCAQLLDIRGEKSLAALGSPNLMILNKEVVQVCFSEGDEDRFLKKVFEKFDDPQETVVCILDNFDGNSMKAAELLFKNGFKEVYAIEGGVLGKQGWKDIQEKFLPPSVHIYRKKRVKKSVQQDRNGVHPLSSMTDSETEVAGIDSNYSASTVPPSSASPSKP